MAEMEILLKGEKSTQEIREMERRRRSIRRPSVHSWLSTPIFETTLFARPGDGRRGASITQVLPFFFSCLLPSLLLLLLGTSDSYKRLGSSFPSSSFFFPLVLSLSYYKTRHQNSFLGTQPSHSGWEKEVWGGWGGWKPAFSCDKKC